MSYVTNENADIYFVTRYPSDEWDIAIDKDKTQTLATATRLINQLNFVGDKAVSTQINEFPRGLATTILIPVAIMDACCEIAYALLEGHDVNYDIETLNVVNSKFGNVTLNKDIHSTSMHLIHGIPSGIAWQLLRPYLRATSTIKIERIS